MAEGTMHDVVQGDSVESVAFENGHFWKTLWDHPENANLKQLRKDPHVLYPGDRLFVPDLRIKEELRSTDARHTFLVKGVPSKLRLVVLDNNKPVAKQRYVLMIDGVLFEGTTNSDGSIERAIPPNAKSGKLIVAPGVKERIYPLTLGGLDPVTEIQGIQGRLRNLGFPVAAVDGELGDDTVEALRMFQSRNSLAVTGEPDSATQEKLKSLHGC